MIGGLPDRQVRSDLGDGRCLSILASAIWIVWRIVPAGVPITFDQDAAFKAVEVIETVVWFISGNANRTGQMCDAGLSVAGPQAR